jgi:pimeloyl-ACP methyl ester carboxylesterase
MVAQRIDTVVGGLHVSRTGGGPPTVLWHSLFLDSRSWCGLDSVLARARDVIAIDGPSHGRSEGIGRDFTFDDCVTAAGQVLDALGVTEAVDWVGNAWGGHVGIRFATAAPHRVRSLTTIGTPAHALRPAERWVKVAPLVQIYRLLGPIPLLRKPLADALVGAEAVDTVPALAAEVMRAFTEAPKDSMFHAMRSMMMRRPAMATDLARLTIPTLMIAARDDITGWRPSDADAVAATMPNARVVGAAGSGHSSPLLVDLATVERALDEFWLATTP